VNLGLLVELHDIQVAADCIVKRLLR
jgi:hypothetical protein